MTPVKSQPDPFEERLNLILQLLSPWREKALTYGELAEKLGGEITEDAVKGWVKRQEFAVFARERIVEVCNDAGIMGVTTAWLRDGTGPQPRKGVKTPPGRSYREPSAGGAAAQAVATDGDVKMLAQRMTVHWKRIAQTRELTGPTLIPLLEEEARWFRGQGYMECYDATLDLIREIRWIEKRRERGTE